MWDFQHAPRNAELAERYDVHFTKPSLCAEELLSGRADLGLIPIASLAESLTVVPGCAIASLNQVRSIQLVVKTSRNNSSAAEVLRSVQTVAADTASRSSVAYAEILFRRYFRHQPEFLPHEADPISMLSGHDAALLIGDPALVALERRAQIEQACGPCAWFDVAELWVQCTGLPWVAAVWAVRPEALDGSMTGDVLFRDLQRSRDAGLANVGRIVEEWSGRIAVPGETIRTYLTRNIYYKLTPACLDSIRAFRAYAAELGILRQTTLRFL
jgi:chorismate dehydratase